MEARSGTKLLLSVIAIAATEAAVVGLGLIISIYLHYKTTNVNDVNDLKG